MRWLWVTIALIALGAFGWYVLDSVIFGGVFTILALLAFLRHVFFGRAGGD